MTRPLAISATANLSSSSGDENESEKNVDVPVTNVEVDLDRLSLEEKNEREVIEHPDEITPTAQIGVQKAEAMTLIWSKTAMYGTYAWIWLCFFILSLQSSINSNVIYYAYANFSSAPQISQADILAAIISGILELPIARILNLWGRAEGFLVFLGLFLIGIIVMAACNNANSFAAGYTLYSVGYTSVNFILSIFLADTSGLRNRAFVYAFIGTPTICTAFVGPLAAQAFLDHSSWQWSYGSFVIIIFVVFAPLSLVFKFYERKARKIGLFVRVSSGRTKLQSIIHYFHEFDIIGVFLLMAAFVLILLPFNLEIYGYAGYKSATFIAMIIIGALLFPVFAAWERYGAKQQFIKWQMLKNRTALGACVLSGIIFFNYYVWDTYYYYYVEVVYNLNTTDTGYMTQIYGIGSTIEAVFFGIWIRQTKRFKSMCLYFGAPLMMLGAGLMIHFRGSESRIGYLIMCQIFIAFGGGTLVIGDDMAMMSTSDREGIPMMIAVLSLCGNIGGAIGYATAAAIYSNTFPLTLYNALPDSSKADYLTIYLGGSATQMLYAVGSDERTAINYAWAVSQKYLCIAAAVSVALIFPAIAVWKNYSVNKKQVKGNVI
ncbi:siderophore iron transporter mirB [Limtongia smithiae]|uniref:siderophore iron transporter mirB n=1 Tax=Limtongia smithiae TaxID=1125753 RepID=UPI0034CEDD58